jgi:hypothetical protein
MKLIQTLVADAAPLRLIGKCVHVEELDDEDYTEPRKKAIQGSASRHYTIDKFQWRGMV